MVQVLAKTTGMDRAEWLKLRRTGIGSSDAAAIAGLNRYVSPVQVYLDKIGELPAEEHPPSEAAHFGILLEDLVAQEFRRRTGLTVQRRNAILQHSTLPWMLANVDRVILGADRGTGILECKTTSAWRASDWDGGQAPFAAQVQLQHQLAVTGYQWGALAVLIGGQRFEHQIVERDEEIIIYLTQLEREFWARVQTRKPPELDGSPASSELMRRLYPEGEADKRVLLPLEAEDLIRAYSRARDDEFRAQEAKDLAANRLRAMLGTAEIGLIAGEERVTWKTVTSNRIDSKRLKREQPDIYRDYSAESISRRFSVKEDG